MIEFRSHPNPGFADGSWKKNVHAPNSWYRSLRWACRAFAMFGVKIRIYNRHNEPVSGGVVYVSNHQSFFDPVIAAMALQRPMNFMARETLFRNFLFRSLIQSLNAFPIKRASADTGALKEAMRRLKKGGQITIFPEGTRTRDGRIGHFLPGVSILSRRASEWTVPVTIDGAFETWPRSFPLPSPTGDIVVCYGKPIHRSVAEEHEPEVFIEMVRRKIYEMQCEIRRRRGLKPLELVKS